MVWREEHSRRLQICQNHIPHEEEMGGGTLSEGQERALSHHVSNVEVKVGGETFSVCKG